MKFEEKIRKFMYGRYGPDELYKFLFNNIVLPHPLDPRIDTNSEFLNFKSIPF